MNFQATVEALNSSSSAKVIQTINLSIYVDELGTEDEVVIHAGFTFKTHTGKEFELLYDLINHVLIRQVLMQYPAYWRKCGVFFRKSKRYFDTVLPACMISMSKVTDKLNFLRFENIKEQQEFLEKYESFELKADSDDNTDGETIKYSSQRNFETIMFFDGNVFSRFISESEWRNSNSKQHEDDYEERESYGRYSGTHAQDVEDLSDNFIDDVFDGDPDAYWNID